MPQPHVQSHETGQRLRLFQALAHATLLQDQPILLGLDDAHWADGDSLDWLLFLLRNNPRTRLMVILTRCTGDSEPSGQLFQVCNELQRNSRLTEIILGRLDRSEAETLANRLGGRPFAETTLDFLYEFSEGNPLFIVEAIRMHDLALREAKQAGLARIKVSLKNLTSSMQARLSDRLAYLSPAAAQTLEIAAVIGRTFQADTIMSAGFYDEEPLLNSLDELMSRALILELDQKEYTFEHELLRQFVYDRMSHRRREYLHRRVAEALR